MLIDGSKLMGLRLGAWLTRKEFSEVCGISYVTISELERGWRAEVRASTLESLRRGLAEALGRVVGIEELLQAQMVRSEATGLLEPVAVDRGREGPRPVRPKIKGRPRRDPTWAGGVSVRRDLVVGAKKAREGSEGPVTRRGPRLA